VQFAIPEGLADISDLARPAAGAESKSKLAVHLGDGDDDLNLDDLNLSLGDEKASVAAFAADDDLSLDDLNLSLGGEKASVAASAADDDKLVLLSLDDIDLSGGLEVVPSPRPLPLPSRPVDDDLNFNLDLGTIGEEKDRPQKNKSDDLPELTLSLD